MVSKYDCLARVATPADTPAILKFYREHPSNNVVIRKPEEVERSVANELFVILENDERKIFGGAGVYILGNEQPIACEKVGRRRDDAVLWGTVGEIGSVEVWKGGLAEDKRYPKIWRSFEFSLPMLLFSQRVGIKPQHLPETPLRELPIDYLVTSIFETDKKYAPLLTGEHKASQSDEEDGIILSPLRMPQMIPAWGYLNAFSETTDDEKAGREKIYFKASVGNLPRVARYLNQCLHTGLINEDGDVLRIDMSELVKRWEIGRDINNKPVTVLDRIIENGGAFAQHGGIGWKEYGRIRDQIESLSPRSLIVSSSEINGHSAPISNDNIPEAGTAIPLRSNNPLRRGTDAGCTND